MKRPSLYSVITYSAALTLALLASGCGKTSASSEQNGEARLERLAVRTPEIAPSCVSTTKSENNAANLIDRASGRILPGYERSYFCCSDRSCAGKARYQVNGSVIVGQLRILKIGSRYEAQYIRSSVGSERRIEATNLSSDPGLLINSFSQAGVDLVLANADYRHDSVRGTGSKGFTASNGEWVLRMFANEGSPLLFIPGKETLEHHGWPAPTSNRQIRIGGAVVGGRYKFGFAIFKFAPRQFAPGGTTIEDIIEYPSQNSIVLDGVAYNLVFQKYTAMINSKPTLVDRPVLERAVVQK